MAQGLQDATRQEATRQRHLDVCSLRVFKHVEFLCVPTLLISWIPDSISMKSTSICFVMHLRPNVKVGPEIESQNGGTEAECDTWFRDAMLPRNAEIFGRFSSSVWNNEGA